METKQKLELMEEIKRTERELFLKISKLASVEAMEYGATRSGLVGEGLGTENWEKALCELIKLIGMRSTGGDSVEDVPK